MQNFKLEKPECVYGYTHEQIKRMLNDEQLKEFDAYMVGKTVPVCAVTPLIPIRGESKPYCGPHGLCVYPVDFEVFLLRIFSLGRT
jgi:hypothetical protein